LGRFGKKASEDDRIMKIVLVIPPSPFLIDDRVFPFLGPLQIGAVARDMGHDVSVADLTGFKRRHPEVKHADYEIVMVEAKKNLLEAVKGADVVGFYSLAAQHPQVVQLNDFVKEHAPDCVRVLGGPHANTAPASCIKDGFQYVIVADQGGGGGEPGFIELLRRLERQKTSVRSLIADEKIIKVASRIGTKWENDHWPMPARDMIDLNSYVYYIEGERATSIVSATGCPFACTYCSHWSGYRKLEAKSAEYVRNEIKYIKEHYGWRAIMFYDDEINLRPDFTTEFLPMLKEEGVIWRAFFKNGKNLTNDSTFKLMVEAGCVQLCTGAESANEKILRDIKKGATLGDNTAFVRLCVKHGIKPKVFTQVGLPGETPDTIVELRDWLTSMAKEGLSDADVSITTPYEGTPIFDNPENHAITFNKEELDFSHDVVLYKGVPGEYKSYVSHPGLTAGALVKARQWVEDEFRSAANLQPLLAKDDG